MSDPVRAHHVSGSDFGSAVLERSAAVPVLVDFWAPWCGPCRILGPVLERLETELAGAFVLAKVNCDEEPELAMRYGVQGIPAVHLFRDGRVVDAFVGALPESDVRAFLARHLPSAADDFAERALRSLAAGDEAAARQALERALAEDPGHPGAHLASARLALRRLDLDRVREHAEAVPASAGEYDAARHLLAAAELIREAGAAGSQEDCERRLAADPDDLGAAFALGGHALARDDLRGALERFLVVAQRDREWRDQAARRAMLVVFGILGARHPTSDEFRERLSAVYY